MKLKKPIYGLVDAPRVWYLEAVRRFHALGFVRHPLDPCFFLYFAADIQNDGEDLSDKFVCCIGMHVDDLLSAADFNNHAVQSLLDSLR